MLHPQQSNALLPLLQASSRAIGAAVSPVLTIAATESAYCAGLNSFYKHQLHQYLQAATSVTVCKAALQARISCLLTRRASQPCISSQHIPLSTVPSVTSSGLTTPPWKSGSAYCVAAIWHFTTSAVGKDKTHQNSSRKLTRSLVGTHGAFWHRNTSYHVQQHVFAYNSPAAGYTTTSNSTRSRRLKPLVNAPRKSMPDEALRELPEIHALLVRKGLSAQQAERVIQAALKQAPQRGVASFNVHNVSKLVDFLQSHGVCIPTAITNHADVLLRKLQPENAEKVVIILEHKLRARSEDVAVMLKNPLIVFAPAETVNAAVMCIKHKLCCSWDDVRCVALNNASCLKLLPQNITFKIDWLLGCGFDLSTVLKFCLRTPVLISSVHDTLQPNFHCLLAYMSSATPHTNIAQQQVCTFFGIHSRLLTHKSDSPLWRSRMAFRKDKLQQSYAQSLFALGKVLSSKLTERTAPRFALLDACGVQKRSNVSHVLIPNNRDFVQALAHSIETGQGIRSDRRSTNSQQAASLLKHALSQPPYAAALRTLLHQPAASAQLRAALQSDSLDPAQVMPLFTQVYLATPEGQKWLRLERGEGELGGSDGATDILVINTA